MLLFYIVSLVCYKMGEGYAMWAHDFEGHSDCINQGRVGALRIKNISFRTKRPPS